MRSGPDQNSRRRFNGNRPSHQQPRGPSQNQTHDSHGPGERIRGTASQIYQRYLTLAQEAARSDDRVAAENYYQHAEHYLRVNNDNRGGNSPGTSQPIDRNSAQTGFVGEIAIGHAQPQTDDDQPPATTPDL
jgi:hypothetical protein